MKVGGNVNDVHAAPRLSAEPRSAKIYDAVRLGPVYNHIVIMTILTAYIMAAKHASVFS
jgi:hypothetical protein